jgi:hypothetical protein
MFTSVLPIFTPASAQAVFTGNCAWRPKGVTASTHPINHRLAHLNARQLTVRSLHGDLVAASQVPSGP